MTIGQVIHVYKSDPNWQKQLGNEIALFIISNGAECYTIKYFETALIVSASIMYTI